MPKTTLQLLNALHLVGVLIRGLGPLFWVPNFEFQYFGDFQKNEYFWWYEVKIHISTVWDPHPQPGTSAAQGCAHRPPKLYRTNSRMCHQHGPVLGGSLYSIDGTQTDSLCYSESSMVWLTALPTTDYIHPNDTRTRGSQRLRQLQATKDVYKYSFYPRTISDWNRLPIPLVPMPRLSRILGKASQVCLPSSCDPTRLRHLYIVLTGIWGILPVLSGITVFTQVNLQSEKITTLTVE